jgi:hypothetical protein
MDRCAMFAFGVEWLGLGLVSILRHGSHFGDVALWKFAQLVITHFSHGVNSLVCKHIGLFRRVKGCVCGADGRTFRRKWLCEG